MDLTLREEYWIKFCMKLIAVISHDNYYRSSCVSLKNSLSIGISCKSWKNYNEIITEIN
jgi:hypothetical protein